MHLDHRRNEERRLILETDAVKWHCRRRYMVKHISTVNGIAPRYVEGHWQCTGLHYDEGLPVRLRRISARYCTSIDRVHSSMLMSKSIMLIINTVLVIIYPINVAGRLQFCICIRSPVSSYTANSLIAIWWHGQRRVQQWGEAFSGILNWG